MVELRFGLRTVDLPYMVRIPDISEAQFDDLVDEDTKAELLDGVMIVHSPASLRHDDVAGFLRSLMRFFAGTKKLGKVLGSDSLIHLATCRKFAPDLFFLRKDRVPRRLKRKQFEGAPDLIVEILSPSTRDYDLHEKRPAYRQGGVKEIWFVDLDAEAITIDTRRKKSYVTQRVTTGRALSTAMPGFWIEAAWLWSDPLPEDELSCLQQILG